MDNSLDEAISKTENALEHLKACYDLNPTPEELAKLNRLKERLQKLIVKLERY